LKPPRKKKAAVPRPPSPRRLWLFRVAALALPLLLLIGLEAGLRLGGYGFDPHFFKEIEIGGENYYVQNDAFSYRFFPPQNARNPGVLRMRAVKQPGTFRIFVFGESAAMGDPEPAYGPARYLEVQLRHKFPGAKFEIVNVAFTAINSHVILPIARECAEHAGDCWIIYMGNNEMVGPFGAATVFGRRAPPLPYVRLVTAVQATRIGQLFTALARKFQHGGAQLPSWGGMEMFLNNQIPPDSPLRENVYRNFEKNLDDILRAGTGAGARILLNTVAVNLKDCPPFASLSAGNVPPADKLSAESLFKQAGQLESAGDFSAAEQICARAAQLDPRNAGLQFLWGKCLLAQNDLANARQHLQLACDDDALPFRTDSRLNDKIHAAADKYHDSGVDFFDAASAMARENPDDLCGDETFYEHVHFDFNGSYRLGLAWAGQVEKMLPQNLPRAGGWLAKPECDDQLGLSDWNRATVWGDMAGRLQVPPFSSQPGNAERVAKLQARVRELRAGMDTNDAVQARENFLTQIAREPGDFELQENFALFLQATGDLPDAISEWRQVHDLIPQDYLPYFQMGRFLSSRGQWAEAEADLRTAVKIHPSLTQGWFELGNVLALQQRYAEALENYAVARGQQPRDAQTIFRMGKAYAELQQPAEALQCYREAAKLDAGDWQIHYQLGGALDAASQLDESLAEFAAAAQLNPGYSHTHFNYGILLAKLGRLDEARREFAEALRLEPGYKNAQDALTKVQMLLQQRQSGN
jgi:tetratricopeptide (TPR) repeat protein